MYTLIEMFTKADFCENGTDRPALLATGGNRSGSIELHEMQYSSMITLAWRKGSRWYLLMQVNRFVDLKISQLDREIVDEYLE